MTVLKYVEPAPMGSTEEPKAVTTTVHAYDQQQLKGLIKSQLMGIGMMCVMHLYFKFTQPLFMQSVLGLKGLYESKMVQLYILGKPAEGDLKRPFKAGGMFGAASDPQTDKAAIDEAEKKVGKKEE